MRSKDEEILTEANKRGGVFDPHLLGATYFELVMEPVNNAIRLQWGLRSHMKAELRRRPFQILFISSNAMTSCAVRATRSDCVLLPIGAVQRLLGAACSLMATPEFMPFIGDSSVERPLELNGVHALPFFPLPNTDHTTSNRRFLSEDGARRSFALALVSSALNFLLHHEVGHFMAGHFEMGKSGKGAKISEFNLETEPSEDFELPPTRVLECDADTFAAHSGSFVDIHAATTPAVLEPYGWKNIDPYEAGFVLHATAVALLFKLSPQTAERALSKNPKVYQHPSVRASMAISRAFALAVNRRVLSLASLPRLMSLSAWQIENTWRLLSLDNALPVDASSAAEEVVSVTDVLVREYASWQPRLRPFARIPTRWHIGWPDVPG